METKDLIVIGGGINGAGIAADAAGRGLSVLMLEARDLACATSSASSKLIHGGLRYLEHYEFRLVSEALAEREVLLKMAPHIAFPMRFRLPHRPHLRPAWMIRIGLFMYDHLGKRTSLPGSTGLRLAQNRYLNRKLCAVSNIPTAGSTMPAWCWPTRRWSSAKAAKCVPAPALSRRNVRMACGWWKRKILIAVRSLHGRRAAGQCHRPMGQTVLRRRDASALALRHPSDQGSHIVVPRVHTQKQAYILQNEDKRIVFVIPWMDEFSIIGTTDVEYKGDPKAVAIDDKEINYLLNVYNAHFKRPSAGTISSGPTPASVRCATTSRIRRRPLPATIPRIFTMRTVRRRCCPSSAAS